MLSYYLKVMSDKFCVFTLIFVVMLCIPSAYAVDQANKLYGSSLWGMSIDQVISAENIKDPSLTKSSGGPYRLMDVDSRRFAISIGKYKFNAVYLFDGKSMNLFEVFLMPHFNFQNSDELRDENLYQILEYVFQHLENEISVIFGTAEHVNSEPFKRIDRSIFGWIEESESIWYSKDTKITLRASRSEKYGVSLSIIYTKR